MGTRTRALNRGPQSEAFTKGPKRPRKRIEIENIYPEKSHCEAFIHATVLLDLLKAECTPGKYVKKKQLERWYAELCAQECWQPRHWTAIAGQLGKLTDKRTAKENGKKSVAYRIPKP